MYFGPSSSSLAATDNGMSRRNGQTQVVTLIVTAGDDTRTAAGGLRDDFVDHELLAIAERDGEGAIPLEELRERLKSIRGSMSDVVISERGDY